MNSIILFLAVCNVIALLGVYWLWRQIEHLSRWMVATDERMEATSERISLLRRQCFPKNEEV